MKLQNSSCWASYINLKQQYYCYQQMKSERTASKKPEESIHSQKEPPTISNIYEMISQQENAIDYLLGKYVKSGQNAKETPLRHAKEQRSKTLDVNLKKVSPRVLQFFGKKENSDVTAKLQLPVIRSGRRSSNNSSKGQQRSISTIQKMNAQIGDVGKTSRKRQIAQNLRKAYNSNELALIRKIPKEIKREKSDLNQYASQNIYSQGKEYYLSQDINRSQTSKIKQSQLTRMNNREQLQPIGTGYLSKIKDEQNSSSSQEDVPLAYYQKQYRQLMQEQCLEQANFLYFSKNESVSSWTEGLLLLFEKHDRVLAGLRKRCKYLEKFDLNFFSIDIFQNQ